MKYLITGITGFAGPHLANLLIEEGHDVFGLIRKSNGMETDILDIVSIDNFSKIKFVYSDLTNLRSLTKVFKENKFDGVFHLAAQSHPPTSFIDPIGTMEDNVVGSANLIQVIADLQPDCPLMFCSTSEVYGNIGLDKRKITVNDKVLPANPYGVSKASTDLYMQERLNNKVIRGFITRAFSHTGPRRGKTFSISGDAYQLAKMRGYLSQAKPSLKIGNLETTRVVMDVRDTVNAYYILMKNIEKTNGQVFNVCGSEPRKMQFFTDKLIEISKLESVTMEIDPSLYRKHDIYYQHGDCSSLLDLGWKEQYNIDTTLTDLYNYWVCKIWAN